MSYINDLCFRSTEVFIEPNAIEMKTMKTNVVPQKIPVFKIEKDTRCFKRTHNSRFRSTSVVLQPGEIYWGHIIMHKNRIYIDISECYKSKMGNKYTSMYIPIIFDMTGKYMLNASEYNGPMYF